MRQIPLNTSNATSKFIRTSRPLPALAGVRVALQRAVSQMGVKTATKSLLKLNQADGFDCMSCVCARPESGGSTQRRVYENGAKAVAEEATRKRATPEFFAAHSIADLDSRDEYWLGQQGRITHPMVKHPGATH